MQIPTVPPSNQPHVPALPYISESQSPHLTANTSSTPQQHRQIPPFHRRSCSSPPCRIMPYSIDAEKGGSGVCDGKPRTNTWIRRRSQSFQEPRKFPPAMPLLAWNGNGNVQMPWVLKRSYTDNGRLVIHEVKVRRHDFFRVNRTDGRLTLHLMHMDETPPSPPPASQEPTTTVEALDLNSNKKKEKEEKRIRNSLLRPAPLPKREKHKLHASPEKEDQETKKGNESFKELKTMEQRLCRLPISSSSSSLSSLASALSTPKMPTAMEKTGAVASLLRQGNYRRSSDVSRVSSLPSITTSMPELLLGSGGKSGGGGGCLTDNRAVEPNSPLQVQVPAIELVQS